MSTEALTSIDAVQARMHAAVERAPSRSFWWPMAALVIAGLGLGVASTSAVEGVLEVVVAVAGLAAGLALIIWVRDRSERRDWVDDATRRTGRAGHAAFWSEYAWPAVLAVWISGNVGAPLWAVAVLGVVCLTLAAAVFWRRRVMVARVVRATDCSALGSIANPGPERSVAAALAVVDGATVRMLAVATELTQAGVTSVVQTLRDEATVEGADDGLLKLTRVGRTRFSALVERLDGREPSVAPAAHLAD